MPEQNWGTLNQDTMGGMNWEDFIRQMTMNAAMSGSPYDDFYTQYDGANFTTGRSYNNVGGMGGGGGAPGGSGPAGGGTAPGATTGTTTGANVANGATQSGWWNNPWVQGGIGAVGSYLDAERANDPRTTTTGGYSTPYMDGALAPHLQTILQQQQALYQANAAAQGAQAPRRQGGGGGGGGGAQGIGNLSQDVAGMFQGVYNAAGNLQNDPYRQQWGNATNSMVQGGGNSGFANYNPTAEHLFNTLSSSSIDRNRDLYMQFLGSGETFGGGGGAGGGSGSGGGGGGGGRGGGGYYGSSSYSGGGGMPPDATGNGVFGTQVRKIFDDAGNEQVMSDLIASMSGDALSAHWASLADLDAQSQGAGRLGSSYHAAARQGAQGQLSDAVAQASAGVRYNELEGLRNAKLAALGLVNNRDIAAMNDATANASIGASSSAAMAGLDLQRTLGLRGQDLDALQSLMSADLQGLGLMGGLANQRSEDYQSSLGNLGGLAGLSLADLNLGLGAASGLGNFVQGMDSNNVQRAGIGATNARLNFDQQRYQDGLAQQRLNEYLNTIATIGGMGGMNQSTQTQPGAGINPWGAAAMGAMGNVMDYYGQGGRA